MKNCHVNYILFHYHSTDCFGQMSIQKQKSIYKHYLYLSHHHHIPICRKIHDIRKEDLTEAQIEDIISSSFSSKLNRLIMCHMANNHNHLMNVQVS